MIEYRVLGPVEVSVDGRPVPLPAAKPRALLTLLLLSRNRVVPIRTLVEGLWGADEPETAAKALQVYVSQLRKAIGGDRVVTRPPGYSVEVADDELDAARFERLAAEGRELLAAGRADEASQRLEAALALWRGPALAEFRLEPFARHAGARLEDSRLAALEDRVDADLALGRHDRLAAELEQLVADHPLRERLRAQQMLALYRSGRQAEALEAYRRTREELVEGLGIEPGPELRELEGAILRHDPALRLEAPHVRPARPAPARRRWPLAAVAAAATLLAAAGIAFALTRDRSTARSTDAATDAFVRKVENILEQSRDGRRAVAAAIGGVLDCSLAPRRALGQLDRVQRNRQSLLQQVAALSVPDRVEALRASDLLQRAEQASIAADWHYRDWLAGRARCGRPAARNSDLAAARTADARATAAKRRFLAVFDPLAAQLGRRVWTDSEF